MTTEFVSRKGRAINYFVSMWHGQEKIRFLVIGVYNTLFGYLVFTCLYLIFHRRVHYLAILTLAHLIAVINAFISHRILTFRAKGDLIGDFFRFNLTYLGTLAISLLGLPLLTELGHLHPLVGQAILMIFNVLASYLLHKRISFRRP